MERESQRLLHEIERERIPDNVDLWPAIHARAATSSTTRRTPQRLPIRAVLLLLASLFVAGATYAVSDVISALFRMEQGLEAVDIGGLAHEIGESQTIEGVTVTVERAYADANRIVIGYMVESADGLRYDVRASSLTDADGNEFPMMTAMGLVGRSEIIPAQLPPGASASVVSFDASALRGEPESLALQLSIGSHSLPGQPEAAAALATDTFQFRFTVPFIVGETVEVGQSVTLENAEVRVCPHSDTPGCAPEGDVWSDVTVRLERIVITPSETRATLCFTHPRLESHELAFIGMLQAGEGPATGSAGATPNAEGPCRQERFLARTGEHPTAWTLTVNEIIEWTYNERLRVNADQRRIQGPWQFTFTAP